ncbi:uncharacterized protein LOC132714356 [Ruditapes philippinarum]|uniref:uncharacterized protein LOC132714356 n=1 Tax=Ruditapes philippinarum TaxID=129788 RepID=UPI00295B9F51|nr:uncharacterized protein LOC132714356 [Ruditapes philippinarum]
MPEYVDESFTYLYEILDCHHLFVNARVKCCSSGIKECGLKRDAWVKVAENCRENGSGLSLALVNELVDKQSNAYAQKTFSPEVEKAMRENGDTKEADFCGLIREWYAADDEPGIEVTERIKRRLRLRECLLKDVYFDKFPPPGSHIKELPHVMFEGTLTNIERRIQIIPHVKSGAFNPRALGSLEAENFFGEFQELDPRGSGVIKPDDIPKAISTACELIGARLDPNRDFYMHTSQAKVYPVHQFMPNFDKEEASMLYITPSNVTEITPRNHYFDQPLRAKRKHGKRKSGEISKPATACRGVRPVREHHKCDESKILPHVRLGIGLPE